VTAVCASAQAETALRRTTLIVGDIDASVTFYTAARFRVTYDTSRPADDPRGVLGGDALPLSTSPNESRIVILQGPGADSGMIGLLEYRDPPLPDHRRAPGAMHRGDVVLMITVADLMSIHEELVKLEAVFFKEPQRYTVENAGGEVVATGLRMFVYDPDGHLVEMVQRD
jgi:catechol 2,3-dioxygenase-like lactoylglutathione lyase family enzyme